MEWTYETGRIYSMDDQNELIAEATYVTQDNGDINIDHVYVNPKLRGQGIADQTMLTVVDYLREKKIKATATCSYANTWFQRNEKMYTDVIANNGKDQVIACKIDGKH